jgi:glycerophosphoryl diester phosphodiesterase
MKFCNFLLALTTCFLFDSCALNENNSSSGVQPLDELIDVWDMQNVEARRPLLIANRGGVVSKDAPECSRQAVRMAAYERYNMVELDVQESKDHVPVVFHDRDMKEACRIDGGDIKVYWRNIRIQEL